MPFAKYVLAIVGLALSVNAHAAVTFFSDETDFLNAAGTAAAVMDYEGVAPAGFLTSINGTYTEDGIAATNTALIIDAGFGGGIYDIGTGASGQTNPNVTSTFSYTNALFAAGVTLFTVEPSGNHATGLVRLTLSSGETLDINTPASNGQSVFVGFVSDVAISSFSLRTLGPNSGNDRRYLETDNVMVFDTAPAPAPLPSALLLFAAGILSARRLRA